MLVHAIEKALKASVKDPDLLSVMDYAVFPAGKLFRPHLVEALALDLDEVMSSGHLHLASAIELHHAYTLVHDDLPSMDNDAIRRGKPSTHIKHGEWKAILSGDALLIASFQEMLKVDHPIARDLMKLFTWATGPKGLIGGQFDDLKAQGKLSFKETIRIHELKTARLIQVASIGSYFLSEKKKTLREVIEFMRLGRNIGVCFQLLDDLTELKDSQLSVHEKEINPFYLVPKEALKELSTSLTKLAIMTDKYKLEHTQKMLGNFFDKTKQTLVENSSSIEQNLGKEISLEDYRCWLTSFA